MKSLLTVLCFLSITSTVFAGQGSTDLDGSIDLAGAEREAFMHAVDNVFSDMLDHDSEVTLKLKGEDDSRYTFIAKAFSAPEVCVVQVDVSKETGMAFNDEARTCSMENATLRVKN